LIEEHVMPELLTRTWAASRRNGGRLQIGTAGVITSVPSVSVIVVLADPMLGHRTGVASPQKQDAPEAPSIPR
jgi:hypothetical protein